MIHDDIDQGRLIADLGQQVGVLTTEVFARGQVIERLQVENADLRRKLDQSVSLIGVPSPQE